MMGVLMHRFFLPKDSINRSVVKFPSDISFQLCKVLRVKPGEEVIVLDNSGLEILVAIENVTSEVVTGSVVRERQGNGEPSAKLHLYQALIPTSKFEYVLQKGVETGVSRFTPFTSVRTNVMPPKENKVERWRKIVRESSEQCGRSVMPKLNAAIDFKTAIKTTPGIKIIPWEKEFEWGMDSVFRELSSIYTNNDISVFVGPAGGFDEEEIKFAREEGARTVSLGNRILRSETAGLVASVLILQQIGDYSDNSLGGLRF